MNKVVEAAFFPVEKRTAGETTLRNELIPASSSGSPRPKCCSSRQGAPCSTQQGVPTRGESRSPLELRVLFLFTCDALFQQSVEEALHGTAAIVLIARNVRDGLQIISTRAGECDLAIIDADQDFSAIAVLEAFESSRKHVPIVLAASCKRTYAKTVASHGRSITCLEKPVPATLIAAELSYPPTPTPSCAVA